MIAYPPALLTSFVYLKSFLKKRRELCMRSWALDSGAFTAHNSGKAISLAAYIDTCRTLHDTDDLLEDVFALDVIGDAKASLRNAEAMHAAGVNAIPTFHFGGNIADLRAMAKDYDKIALGGMAAKLAGNHGQRVSKSAKHRFISECFAAIWPKRVHLFGCTDESLLFAFPAESADSTSWHLQPSRYGLWKSLGRLQGVRGASVRSGIRGQIVYCMNVERQVQAKWDAALRRHKFRPFSYRFAMTGGEAKYFTEGKITA
jgi:hypothetical protein